MVTKKKTNQSSLAQQSAPKQSIAQQTVVAQSWSGPLPPPAVLQNFNNVAPGSAQIIINMAQQQQAHRINMESKIVNDQRIGLIAGSATAVIALCGAIYVAPIAPWVAVSLVSLPVLGFVKVLTGSKEKSSSRSVKNSR